MVDEDKKENENGPMGKEENTFASSLKPDKDENKEIHEQEEAAEKASPKTTPFGSFPPVTPADKKRQAKKVTRISNAIHYTLMASGIILIIGAVIISGRFFVKKPTVTMNALASQENTISYELTIKNDSKIPMELHFVAPKDTHSYDVSSSQTYTDRIKDLLYDTDYTVSVTGNERNTTKTYYQSVIHTPAYVPRTSFANLTWNCHCLQDGNATYDLELTDDFHYWSNYRFVFSQKSAPVFTLTGIEVGQHDIYVLDKPGGIYQLAFVVSSTNPADTSGGTAVDKTLVTIEAGI
jgi:hypothetical protein